MSDSLRPVLRALDLFPIESEGQKLLCLRDPEGYSSHLVFLQPAAVFMIARMDGQNTLQDIADAFQKASGRPVALTQLEGLVADLDQQYLLDSPRFREYKAAAEEAFRTATVRPMAHGGRAYEGEPDKLRTMLNGWMDAASSNRNGQLRALIAPHIDYHRGGPCYGHAYQALRGTDFETVVVLGTSHAPTRRFFAGTLKDFETPLGLLENDRPFMEELMRRYRLPMTDDELVHKNEHAIELQTTFIKHLLPQARIVPILVGSFHPMLVAGMSPWDMAAVRDFVQAMRETVSALGRRVCYIAAADLAHIGTRFGDEEPADDKLMAWVAAEDALSLAEAAAVRPEGWFGKSAAEGDRRRICGLSPIYTMLRVLAPDAIAGKLLQYQQCNEPTGANNVTIASVAYYEKA
ncbi:MAG TPA: AmmeMemoRadiSam system protein B [Candidatus Xenobia bacterium]|jgi:hypothetical protein